MDTHVMLQTDETWMLNLLREQAERAGRQSMSALQTPPRLVTRFGETWCTQCGMQWKPIQYCRCQAPPAATQAKDGADAASLQRRINDCQGR